MATSPPQIQSLLEELFPEADGVELISLDAICAELLEGKDLSKFKGEISVFKQQAIDVAAGMPRPMLARRALAKEARKEVLKVVKKLDGKMNYLLKRLRSEDPGRKISPTRFKREMKSELRNSYIDAYRLGTRASGLTRASDLSAHTSAEEKRWIDNVISGESRYFNKFLDTMIRTESWKRSRTRITNYANAVLSVFEASRVLQLPEDIVIHWVLESGNPCPNCRLLHRLSPYTKYTLPTTPKAGSTHCLSYCYCKLRIVKAKRGEVLRIQARNKSAQHLIKKLKAGMKRAGR